VTERPDDSFLVVTEHGRVLVTVRGDRSGLDNELVEVRLPTADDLAALELETPLRAFAAKMIELVRARGGDEALRDGLRDMLVKEKASEDLRRIERAAKRLHEA
jgi:hypothetical protein